MTDPVDTRQPVGKHEPHPENLRTAITAVLDWAGHVQGMLYRIARNQEMQMAGIDDINTAITALKDEVTVALTDLANNPPAGGISPDDVLAVVNQLNGLHDNVVAAVQAHDNPPTPAPAPATGP